MRCCCSMSAFCQLAVTVKHVLDGGLHLRKEVHKLDVGGQEQRAGGDITQVELGVQQVELDQWAGGRESKAGNPSSPQASSMIPQGRTATRPPCLHYRPLVMPLFQLQSPQQGAHSQGQLWTSSLYLPLESLLFLSPEGKQNDSAWSRSSSAGPHNKAGSCLRAVLVTSKDTGHPGPLEHTQPRHAQGPSPGSRVTGYQVSKLPQDVTTHFDQVLMACGSLKSLQSHKHNEGHGRHVARVKVRQALPGRLHPMPAAALSFLETAVQVHPPNPHPHLPAAPSGPVSATRSQRLPPTGLPWRELQCPEQAVAR
ncbi:hypothetical protein P7K49_005719 [Saguinus oedipus]|uniref:Uncharacterized protein n=1 Tax=Saguinus oedipus TaxID=9490 RepID=A0ABQ9W0D8_SAGOE|nr:hypothetical protein P7K49_005719 [Saguinus oedipus]